jgi:hypothetical protein
MAEQPCDACKRYVEMQATLLRREIDLLGTNLREERRLMLERLNERWDTLQKEDARQDDQSKRDLRDIVRRIEALEGGSVAIKGLTRTFWIVCGIYGFVGFAAIGLLVDHITRSH